MMATWIADWIEQREAQDRAVELAQALLNREGVRIIPVGCGYAAGIWADRDGPSIREALRRVGAGTWQVLYLESAAVPLRYKSRRVSGEPVLPAVLAGMQSTVDRPWEVRDSICSRRYREK